MRVRSATGLGVFAWGLLLAGALLAPSGCTTSGHGKSAKPTWKVFKTEHPQAAPSDPIRSGGVELRVSKVFLEDNHTVFVTSYWRAVIRGTIVSPEALPLGELLSRISAEVGEPIAVDDVMAKETVSVSLRGIPWREGVDVVTRMTCSGETRDTPRGLRVQGLSCYAHVYYTDAPVRTLFCLLAELGGYDLILTPSLRGEVSISSSRRGFLYLLEAVARATDTRAEIRSGLILVDAEPGWGSTDIDGDPVPEPWMGGSDRPPRNVIRARGLPLLAWISLLACHDRNRPVIVSGPLSGTVEADLTNADLMEAIQATATRFGLRVREEGGLLAIKQEGSTAPREGLPISFRAGDHAHHLQGLYSVQIDEDQAISRAVIDGTAYGKGESLTDGEGTETPFALAEVTTDRIVVVGPDETTQAVDFDH